VGSLSGLLSNARPHPLLCNCVTLRQSRSAGLCTNPQCGQVQVGTGYHVLYRLSKTSTSWPSLNVHIRQDESSSINPRIALTSCPTLCAPVSLRQTSSLGIMRLRRSSIGRRKAGPLGNKADMSPKKRRHSLTSTAEVLQQAEMVHFWHSSPKKITASKAVNGASGTKAVSREEVQRDAARRGASRRNRKQVRSYKAELQRAAPALPKSTPSVTPSAASDVQPQTAEIAAMKKRIAELEAIVHGRAVRKGTKPSEKPTNTKNHRSKSELRVDGYPRFEGGIRWFQGGSPGLGKRHR